MTINYRNPKEVSDAAGKVANNSGLYISTVNAVRSVPDSLVTHTLKHQDELDRTLSKYCIDLFKEFVSEDGSGRVAIIVPNELLDHTDKIVKDTLRKNLSDKEYNRILQQNSDDSQISVCTPEYVKGLEYDAVILMQPSKIEQEAASMLTAAANLYVAMTRPTQRLVILRTQDDADFSK
ncbi:Uncharacterised protein [Chlamydia trachomatis]|nr:Uncharacterised protein [Chlamydia trachomatis]